MFLIIQMSKFTEGVLKKVFIELLDNQVVQCMLLISNYIFITYYAHSLSCKK